MSFEFHSLSDPGRLRSNNEDAVSCEPTLGLAVLADGMGGYNAGEIASAMAVSLLRQSLAASLGEGAPVTDLAAARARLQRATSEANRAIYDAAHGNSQYAGMGTTLVLGLFQPQRAFIGHIGDSRCYRWRQGQLTALTRDHSLLQEQIDAGLLSPEEAAYAPHKNLVTRALGVEPEVVLDLAEHAVAPGDVFLLCSDGLNDMLSEAEMARLLQRHVHEPAQAVQALVDAANAAGGRDNISVILVRTGGDAPPRGLLARLFG